MTLRELLNFLSEPRNKAFYLNKQGLPMYLVVNPLMKRNEFFVYDKSYKKIWLGMLSHFIVNHEIIPSYMLDKKRYDATIDIDLIENTHWQVFKKQISFEAVFEEKGGFLSRIKFDRFNDEAKRQIIEKYEALKIKHQKLSIVFTAFLKSSGHPQEPEKVYVEEIFLTAISTITYANYDNILLDLERTFQVYAEHKILHVKSQTWTYQ
ncbi:TPA: hypothetical protein R8907_001110 [Campylobacter jejuni]|nr:hypothetical protein [Campylobacter jejuni]MPO31357.1 hypothetical protein [Campylobacter jejuni]HEF3121378.1 hypothetical protein [Campylobacter jejuni]HEF6528049.1 hypothetical protein [Campylobacter jejuni]HEF8426058.1 hypothetical protein [Campylobacter jejuni]